jgi:DNA-binding response OmpR family regulator
MTAEILVVDDESSIRFFLEETLSNDGHRVTAVENGREAIAEINARAYDLALVDLKLKDMDGLQVLAALRERSPDTAVIMLTAYASLDTAVEALRRGAHDYLFKPCKTVELRESVRTGLLKRQRENWQRDLLSQLERRLAAGPAMPAPEPRRPDETDKGRFLQCGDLIVDFMRHVITLGGQLLELSPTEFGLIAYLASAAPRVVPPEELVREVQGYQVEAREAAETLRYHVYRLREKIKAATGRADVIETRRGVGYALRG